MIVNEVLASGIGNHTKQIPDHDQVGQIPEWLDIYKLIVIITHTDTLQNQNYTALATQAEEAAAEISMSVTRPPQTRLRSNHTGQAVARVPRALASDLGLAVPYQHSTGRSGQSSYGGGRKVVELEKGK